MLTLPGPHSSLLFELIYPRVLSHKHSVGKEWWPRAAGLLPVGVALQGLACPTPTAQGRKPSVLASTGLEVRPLCSTVSQLGWPHATGVCKSKGFDGPCYVYAVLRMGTGRGQKLQARTKGAAFPGTPRTETLEPELRDCFRMGASGGVGTLPE